MLKVPNFPTILPLHIEAQGILTFLSELEPHKVSGPDDIHVPS